MASAADFAILPQLIRSCEKDQTLYPHAQDELRKFLSYYDKFRVGQDREITKKSFLPYGYMSRINSAICLLGAFGPKDPNEIDFESMANDVQTILRAAPS